MIFTKCTSPLFVLVLGIAAMTGLKLAGAAEPTGAAPTGQRVYANRLSLLKNPKPLLADYPEFVQPVEEIRRYEAPLLVDDPEADLEVRAWRFSYNARGIVEMPNRLRAAHTAVIVVHPWGIDDGQGWITPEPAGVADFCTPDKNHLAGRHTHEVVDPFLKRMRGKAALVMYSLRGGPDPIRKQLYRSLDRNPSPQERAAAQKQLTEKLKSFNYRTAPLVSELKLSRDLPVIDYFKQFPGLDAGDKYDGAGYWDLPIPVCSDITRAPDDVVIFDEDGYPPLRKFLKEHQVRHVLLTGYATDMCFCKTTAGYENLSKDFNVFLVGDATLATYPANSTPRYATNAHISFAAINQLITQVSWVKYVGKPETARADRTSTEATP